MDPKAQLGQGWSWKLKVYFLEYKNHFLSAILSFTMKGQHPPLIHPSR